MAVNVVPVLAPHQPARRHDPSRSPAGEEGRSRAGRGHRKGASAPKPLPGGVHRLTCMLVSQAERAGRDEPAKPPAGFDSQCSDLHLTWQSSQLSRHFPSDPVAVGVHSHPAESATSITDRSLRSRRATESGVGRSTPQDQRHRLGPSGVPSGRIAWKHVRRRWQGDQPLR